jgi:hypothetical protein
MVGTDSGLCSMNDFAIRTFKRSRYSDWLQAGWPRGQSLRLGRCKIFLLSSSSRPFMGPTQPPSRWVPGAFTLGVKQPVREADHSTPASAEVKNTWIYTCTLSSWRSA